jgi:regulator of cell morphogenesis and NO signaling
MPPSPPDPDTPLLDLLTNWKTHPAQVRLLRRLGVDGEGGPERTLAEACGREGLDPHTVARVLGAVGDASGAEARADWLSVSLPALLDHIRSAHHDYLRHELPRLSEVLDEGGAALEGDEARWGSRLREEVRALASDLRAQLRAEEEYFFPALRTMAEGRVLPDGSTPVADILRRIEAGHDSVRAKLKRLRTWTEGYRSPGGADAALREAMDRLHALEIDLRRHIYEEAAILLPRVRALV